VATVFTRPRARRDLTEHYVYLAENAGLAIADRFLDNARDTFMALADHPLLGPSLPLSRPELAGLRKWSVDEFENFLIFYFPRPNGVAVVRVLHAAQDWWGLLGVEERPRNGES
jgi:toxin ParE1/3/4